MRSSKLQSKCHRSVPSLKGVRGSRRVFKRTLAIQRLEPRLAMDGSLIISEILAANSGGLNDSDGDSSDWIELYNPTSQPINLQGWALTDSPADLNEWVFPSVTIGANEFLTVFASGKNRAVAGNELHTNFRLSTSGDFLALVRPNGTIEQQFNPSYPPQVSNVSYGAVFQTEVLVDQGHPLKYQVPTNGGLGQAWVQPGFNDTGWSDATFSVGYGVTQPGFEILYVKANQFVDHIAVARDVIATPGMQAFSITTTSPVVNFLGNGSSANYGNDIPFPSQNIGDDYDDFVVRATSMIDIPSAGNWTFGVNSDDGFALVLEQGSTVFTTEYAFPRAPADSFATFDLPSAGAWKATLIFYERGGGAGLEFFAAPGSYSQFDASAFRLVGDIGNGGLPSRFGIDVGTDMQSAMQGQNSSVFLRTNFQVANVAAIESLVLRMRYDDGFVLYLNGAEVARRNAPLTLPFNAAASSDRTASQVSVVEVISLTNAISSLVNGTNTLAIHALNSSADDDSFLIDPELMSISIDTAQPRYFATPTPNEPNAAPYDGIVNQVTTNTAVVSSRLPLV